MLNQFQKLINIIKRLRSKNGCPWDRKQTLKSIRDNIIEEAYETVDAINKNDYELIKEETGDLLFQALFISQLAADKNKFTINDVLKETNKKLTRRHPHIFKNTKVKDVDDVLKNWETIKQQEKTKMNQKSLLDSIPDNLPTLIKAKKIQGKVERHGFKWPTIKEPLKKLKEEMNEFIDAVKNNDKKSLQEEEFGDILFTLVNIGRFMKISPEQALNRSIRKFKKRFYHIEKNLKNKNTDMHSMNIKELESLWKESKLKTG